jgi:hypothetical protein
VVNWEAIGAVGEIVGAIAVVATLAYLAKQIQANSRTSEIQSRVSAQHTYVDFLAQLIASPELDDVFKRGRENFAALRTEEQSRFTNLALQYFANVSSGHYQYSEGVLSDDGWYEHRAVLRYWTSGSGVQDWWKSIGQYFFPPEFRAVVEAEVKRAQTTDADYR